VRVSGITFVVFTAKTMIFWDMSPFSLVGGYA
jgi:hypothetical protein